MLTSILSAIAAIPTLISTIQELIGWFKKANDEKWFQQSTEVFSNIKPGTSSEQKSDSAKQIQDLITKL